MDGLAEPPKNSASLLTEKKLIHSKHVKYEFFDSINRFPDKKKPNFE